MAKIVTGTHRIDSKEYSRLYGPGVNMMQGLANFVIGVRGGQEWCTSHRFRCTHSGYVAGLRLYWQTGSGYASGAGGIVRIRVVPDDGRGKPNVSATPYGECYYEMQLQSGEGSKSLFPFLPFQSITSPLKEGNVYHILQEGIAGGYENYTSSNNCITNKDAGYRPARWTDVSDMASLFGYRNQGGSTYTWRDCTELGGTNNCWYLPIFELHYTDGGLQGNGNMEGGWTSDRLLYTATASSPVAEFFTPGKNHSFQGMSFIASCKSSGSMIVSLVHQGSTIWTTSVTSSYDFHEIPTGRSSFSRIIWRDVEMASPVSMNAGQSYQLIFQPQGSSQWGFGDARNGSAWCFGFPAAFTESEAKVKVGGNWVGYDHWSHNAAGGGANWPVVFHEVSA